MARPSFAEIYMRMAELLAQRSTCIRLQVGCVITSVDHRYVYGLGYNGGAAGMKNECDSNTPGACGHLHGEENAIINCRASRDTPKYVYVTHLPCVMCARRLINLGGVVRVVYDQSYRVTDSIDLLRHAMIRVESMVEHRLNNIVDAWHNGDGSLLLGDVLKKSWPNFTKEEYEAWATQGTIPERLSR